MVTTPAMLGSLERSRKRRAQQVEASESQPAA
jgi:hypothetical protein